MATRKPAASTQIKNLIAELATATAKIAEAEKKFEAEKKSKDTWYAKTQKLEAEIEQVHVLCDVLPGAAGRKTDHEETYYRKDVKMMSRLASYLAHRAA